MPPHGVGFFGRFGLKTGTRLAHFGLESGIVFEGTAGDERTSFQFQMSKKEREICAFETNLRNFFCLHSNLGNTNIISA